MAILEKERVSLNILCTIKSEIDMPESQISFNASNIDDIINDELGINCCLKELQTNKFNGFDSYEAAAYLLKWCVRITTIYFKHILPIKSDDDNDGISKSLFIDSVLNDEYEKMMTFFANIAENKKEYSLSPDDFKRKHNVIEMQEDASKILSSIKNKLIAIKEVSSTELFLPAIKGKHCPIYISTDLKAMLCKTIADAAPDKILILSDAIVGEYYELGDWLNQLAEDSCCVIDEYIIDNASEKTLSQMQDTLMFSESKRLTKASLIIIFGGGSVGSIGGMTAKLYFRGIKYLYVPTTLLSQIDCAIGCKHSLNGALGKNKFGVYNLPESVIINPLICGTLCIEQKKSGLVEALKHGLCQSQKLLDKIINYNYDCFDVISLTKIITETIKCKLEYMKDDPYASSPELAMEFGHKVAHAVEHLSKESMPHGVCVAFGMVAEAKLFSIMYSESTDAANMMTHIIEMVKKVVSHIKIPCEHTNKQIADAVLYDNKRREDAIPFIRLISEQNPSVVWISENDAFMRQLEEAIGFARECFTPKQEGIS